MRFPRNIRRHFSEPCRSPKVQPNKPKHHQPLVVRAHTPKIMMGVFHKNWQCRSTPKHSCKRFTRHAYDQGNLKKVFR